jgi:hypothetical protein
MFHNGPEYYATVFQGDWNAIMNLLADSPDFRTSDPTPADDLQLHGVSGTGRHGQTVDDVALCQLR